MGAAVFLYTLIGIISLCALLGILSHIHIFLRVVFPLIIRRKSYSFAFTLAYFRLLLGMAIVLDLFVLALALSIISVYPEPISGNFTGTWNGTGETSGTMMLVPSFSLEKTLLAIISAGFFGSTGCNTYR